MIRTRPQQGDSSVRYLRAVRRVQRDGISFSHTLPRRRKNGHNLVICNRILTPYGGLVFSAGIRFPELSLKSLLHTWPHALSGGWEWRWRKCGLHLDTSPGSGREQTCTISVSFYRQTSQMSFMMSAQGFLYFPECSGVWR